MTLPAGLILVVVGRMSHLLVKWLGPAKSISVAQWLERPTGIWEVMGSNPVEDSDFFFFLLCSWQRFKEKIQENQIVYKLVINKK